MFKKLRITIGRTFLAPEIKEARRIRDSFVKAYKDCVTDQDKITQSATVFATQWILNILNGGKPDS